MDTIITSWRAVLIDALGVIAVVAEVVQASKIQHLASMLPNARLVSPSFITHASSSRNHDLYIILIRLIPDSLLRYNLDRHTLEINRQTAFKFLGAHA